mmetsp:Transcript_133759/g.316973  ORF Transcript_133759/g.316973 Transcript_133759/m.316973 type:complete len:235 (-) Transcript_133759:5-709(-)
MNAFDIHWPFPSKDPHMHIGAQRLNRSLVKLVATVRAEGVAGRALATAPRTEVADRRWHPRRCKSRLSCLHRSRWRGRQVVEIHRGHGLLNLHCRELCDLLSKGSMSEVILHLLFRLRLEPGAAASSGATPEAVGKVIIALLETRGGSDRREMLFVLMDRLQPIADKVGRLQVCGISVEGLLLGLQQHLLGALLLLALHLSLGGCEAGQCHGSHERYRKWKEASHGQQAEISGA